MILPQEDLLWVRDAAGRRVPFNPERLVASLERAIPGGEPAEVADAIASAIQHFSREQARDGVIALAEIIESAETLLHILGYSEWAQAYARRQQRAEIRLDELAARIATGFELAFYQHLDAALAAAADAELLLVHLRGLRACVLRLRGAQRWGVSCRRLAEEILGHAQQRLARLRPPEAMALELAVTEEL